MASNTDLKGLRDIVKLIKWFECNNFRFFWRAEGCESDTNKCVVTTDTERCLKLKVTRSKLPNNMLCIKQHVVCVSKPNRYQY